MTVPASTQLTSPAAEPVSQFELTDRPYYFVGLAKSTWFRLRAGGHTPKPVKVPGLARAMYRKSDLEAWLKDLPRLC